jgi:hypothetical protein
MSFLNRHKTQIRYDMFDLARSAEEAKRYAKCERIYRIGQDMAWDGKEILSMLLREHGAPKLEPKKRDALKRVFAIILWGELAAWKISAQLADRLVPLEAKMAATSQAHDEARHFYTMYDYLRELDYVPERLDRAPQALLDLVLETDNVAHKLVGMQLMIETIALAVFQTVRESNVEPVLCELLKYYERDEARHVGLGMQYLPALLKEMSRADVLKLTLFQVRLMVHALLETKLLEPEMTVLGIEPRVLIDRVQRKQMAALQEAYEAVGIELDRNDNPITRSVRAAVEYAFPAAGKDASQPTRLRAAFAALRSFKVERLSQAEFAEHDRHVIKTARGSWARAEDAAE